jgi:pimeloyl-ACP methyl ester carboxylesterase
LCWLGWLAKDIKGLAVWSVGYETPISRWRGSAMHLTDRATNILARLLAEPALREGSLILIGHSLGGLVIK